MILIDSSVIIDYLLANQTPEVLYLDRALGRQTFATGDLMRSEVLQGVRSQREWQTADQFMSGLVRVVISDWDCALISAQFYRTLRSGGITIRKTIDCLIATRCILNGLTLLSADRDFAPFEAHFGLHRAEV